MQQDIEARATGAYDELCAWLRDPYPGSPNKVVFAAAKHMAAVAVCLECEMSLSRRAALDAASGLVERRLGLSPASLKKNRSEALAILQFGLASVATSPSNPSRRALFEDVLRASISEARRIRANSLGGARGGRPAAGRPQVLSMVRELVRKAVRDPNAADELQLIRAELSA